MQTDSQLLLSELIEAAKSMDISPGYLAMRAIGNANLPERIKEGASVRPDTARRLRNYIKRELKARKRKAMT